jgi:hypothetical protein
MRSGRHSKRLFEGKFLHRSPEGILLTCILRHSRLKAFHFMGHFMLAFSCARSFLGAMPHGKRVDAPWGSVQESVSRSVSCGAQGESSACGSPRNLSARGTWQQLPTQWLSRIGVGCLPVCLFVWPSISGQSRLSLGSVCLSPRVRPSKREAGGRYGQDLFSIRTVF